MTFCLEGNGFFCKYLEQFSALFISTLFVNAIVESIFKNSYLRMADPAAAKTRNGPQNTENLC